MGRHRELSAPSRTSSDALLKGSFDIGPGAWNDQQGVKRMPTRKAQKRGVETRQQLPPEQRGELLRTLKARFEKNMNRHQGLQWAAVQPRLEANPERLWSLNEMERTGGEPDVVGHDKKTGEYVFYDCSAESPKGRRSVCYDREALEARKEHKPKNSATDMAAAMGIEILTEAQYRELQTLGDFDTEAVELGEDTS
jgi:hypothetical protein